MTAAATRPTAGHRPAPANARAFREPIPGDLDRLKQADLATLEADVAAQLHDDGVTFGDAPFRVCPVPRLLGGDEWERLAAALRQRTRALGAFVRDAYTGQEIVAAGVIPSQVINAAEGYEPELRGHWPSTAIPAVPIVGFDIVRDSSGRLLVLEDNARTPSGYAYAVAARRAVQAALATLSARAGARAVTPFRAPRPVAAATIAALRAVVQSAAAAIGDDWPASIVVLADGPDRAAAFEHAAAARWLGAPLVTPADLTRRGDELWLRGDDRRSARRITAVYRRTDGESLRLGDGRPTELSGLLLRPWLAGRLAVVNAFGTGVADDKLAHAYVEDMIRFYLREEPLIPSVPTLDLGDPAARAGVLEDLRRHVVKPRHGLGGHGVVIGRQSGAAALKRLADRLQEPGAANGFIAQRTVELSQQPTVVDGRLVERHVDLRPFAFADGDRVTVVPGGLTRVAWESGSLVVNSSQAGGAKDTWVVG